MAILGASSPSLCYSSSCGIFSLAGASDWILGTWFFLSLGSTVLI
jgi:hypothetical protein